MNLPFSLHQVLIITRREIRDQLRDWRITTPIILLTLFFPLLMSFVAQRAADFVFEFGGDAIIIERFIPFLLMVVGFFPTSISLVIALESFVGEKERYSLEPLLSSPLSDAELYLGKMLACTVPPLIAAGLGMTVYLVGLALTVGWYATPELLAIIVTLTALQALVMVAGAVVLSGQTTSVRAANLLSSFIVVPFALLINGESILMFWGMYDVLWLIALALALLLVVLVRMGVKIFNREELLGRDLDEVNLAAIGRALRAEWVGVGSTPALWWTREIPATLQRLAAPILVTALTVLAGLALGAALVAQYPLSITREQLNLGESATFINQALEQSGLASAEGAAWVLLYNIRGLALASFASIFSFGIVGLALLMVPFGLIGFVGGQLAAIGLNPVLLLAAVAPHGLFEVPAALIAGGAMVRLGACVIAPPPGKTLGQGWLTALADWAKAFVAVVVPLLVLGALMEAFVTPWVTRLVLPLL